MAMKMYAGYVISFGRLMVHLSAFGIGLVKSKTEIEFEIDQ